MANPTGLRNTIVGTLSVHIDSDLSGKEGYAVNFDTTDDLVVNLATDATLPSYVLIEGADGSTDATVGTIALPGSVAAVKLAEAATAGKHLVPTAASKWEVADAAGERYGCIALTNGAADDMILAVVALGEVEASDA